MNKQIQIFFTSQDESNLSGALTDELPRISFLDDNVWRNSPECRNGIEECESGRAYLFNGLIEELPTLRRKSGETEGPVSGCVIQILRPIAKDGVLLSGRVAVGFDKDDEQMCDFVSKVWKCVRKSGHTGVIRPDGAIDKHYLVGHDARRAVRDGLIQIADRAVGLRYEPAVQDTSASS